MVLFGLVGQANTRIIRSTIVIHSMESINPSRTNKHTNTQPHNHKHALKHTQHTYNLKDEKKKRKKRRRQDTQSQERSRMDHGSWMASMGTLAAAYQFRKVNKKVKKSPFFRRREVRKDFSKDMFLRRGHSFFFFLSQINWYHRLQGSTKPIPLSYLLM